MEIIDNFLEDDVFKGVRDHLLRTSLWGFNDHIDNEEEEGDGFQFIHAYMISGHPISPHCKELYPVMNKIAPLTFSRIKANLITRTPKINEHSFHTDLNLIKDEERLKQWTTGILYINTNNGYTFFEDGSKVESVANRYVSFPSNLKHAGTSCSDKKIRVVINFNYFEK